MGTRTVAFEDRALRSYVGGWPEYVRIREERRREAAGNAPRRRRSPAAEDRGQGSGQDRGQGSARAAKNRAAALGPGGNGHSSRIEAEIEAAEAELRALEDELADPASWSGAAASERSSARHAEAKRRVQELYERWESSVG